MEAVIFIPLKIQVMISAKWEITPFDTKTPGNCEGIIPTEKHQAPNLGLATGGALTALTLEHYDVASRRGQVMSESASPSTAPTYSF